MASATCRARERTETVTGMKSARRLCLFLRRVSRSNEKARDRWASMMFPMSSVSADTDLRA